MAIRKREPNCIRGNIKTLKYFLPSTNIRGYSSEVCGIPIVVNDTLRYGTLELI